MALELVVFAVDGTAAALWVAFLLHAVQLLTATAVHPHPHHPAATAAGRRVVRVAGEVVAVAAGGTRSPVLLWATQVAVQLASAFHLRQRNVLQNILKN